MAGKSGEEAGVRAAGGWGGGLVTPGGTAKEARGVVSVVGNMARALRAVILPRKPSLGAQNQIKREVDAAL